MTDITTHWPWLIWAILALLTLGGTLRLTRLITSDDLGRWLLRGPLERWALDKEHQRRAAMRRVLKEVENDPHDRTPAAMRLLAEWERQLDDGDEWLSWQARLVSGLGCPFCVGFWIGLGVTLGTIYLASLAILGVLWVVFLAVLTLNYIAGHISARLD